MSQHHDRNSAGQALGNTATVDPNQERADAVAPYLTVTQGPKRAELDRTEVLKEQIERYGKEGNDNHLSLGALSSLYEGGGVREHAEYLDSLLQNATTELDVKLHILALAHQELKKEPTINPSFEHLRFGIESDDNAIQKTAVEIVNELYYEINRKDEIHKLLEYAFHNPAWFLMEETKEDIRFKVVDALCDTQHYSFLCQIADPDNDISEELHEVVIEALEQAVAFSEVRRTLKKIVDADIAASSLAKKILESYTLQ